jgi:hypothetical protein
MKPRFQAILFPAIAVGLTITNIQAAPLAAGDHIGIDFGPTAPTNNMNQVNSASGSITAGNLISTTNVTVNGNLSYTLPTGLGKQFVRLLVTPTP